MSETPKIEPLPTEQGPVNPMGPENFNKVERDLADRADEKLARDHGIPYDRNKQHLTREEIVKMIQNQNG